MAKTQAQKGATKRKILLKNNGSKTNKKKKCNKWVGNLLFLTENGDLKEFVL